MAKHIPHAIYTNSELLELNRASIADVLAAGQKLLASGKSVDWAPLRELRAEETHLQNLVAGSAIATNLSRHGRNGGSLIKT